MSRTSLLSSLVLCLLAVLVNLVRPTPSESSYMWTPAVKFTDSHNGTRLGGILWGQGDSVYIHYLVKECVGGPPLEKNCGAEDAIGWYLAVDSTLNWVPAWNNRHLLSGDTQFHMQDFRVVADETDEVHVVSEIFNLPFIPTSGAPAVGYQRSRGDSWDSTTVVALSDTSVAGRAWPDSCPFPRITTPRIFYDESTEILHVTYPYRSAYFGGLDSTGTTDADSIIGGLGFQCFCNDTTETKPSKYCCADTCDTNSYYSAYTWRYRTDPDTAWRKVSYITNVFDKKCGDGPCVVGGASRILVDNSGIVHLWGNQTVKHSDAPDSVFYHYVWGKPPADTTVHRWAPGVDVFDTTLAAYAQGGPGASPGYEDGGAEVSRELEADDSHLFVTWSEPGGPAFIQSIVLTGSLDSAFATEGTPRQLTRGNAGVDDDLYRTPDNSHTWHYLYAASPGGGSGKQIWHKYVTTSADPYDATSATPGEPGDWSTPSMFTVDQNGPIGDAFRASFLAREDSAWVTFIAPDTAGLNQSWFRHGWALGDSVASGDKVTWDGIVSLDRDFYVAPAGTLVVNAGTMVVAADSTDNGPSPWGVDSSLVEIIVGGTLFSEGTANDHVTFRGTDTTKAGSWYGIRFLDNAADTSASNISYTDFWSPRFAVGVDSLSGNIVHCTFANSESADVYVDRDTRIPAGYQWLLDAPTNVVINDTDLGANWGTAEEDSERVEIYFESSTLETTRPIGASSSDSVWFRSKASTPASDDWYGIGSIYSTMLVDDASIGYATNPLYFGGAEEARLKDSRIHTFRDVGVFDWASNALVEDNVVEGANGGPVQGRIGIHSLVSAGTIEGNTVTWEGASGTDAKGIAVEYYKSYCDGLAGHDSVHVVANTITGAGEGAGLDNTGLYLFWGCERRHPRIRDNLVEEWSKRGMWIQQCAETQVMCNDVIDNKSGIYYTRNNAQSGDSTRFYQNELLKSDEQNFETDWAYRLMLRDDYADPNGRGKNHLQPDTSQTSFSVLLSGPFSLDAIKNEWITAGGSVTTDSATIASMIKIDSLATGTVDHSSPLSGITGFQNCGPAGARMFVQRGEEVAEPSNPPADLQSAARIELPAEFALHATFPNPVRSRAEIGYDVPAGYAGDVTVTVFDVTGRRVKSLVRGQIPPGYHRAIWTGSDEGGRRVAAGVYFVRMDARGFRKTAKVVLLQ